MRVGVTGIASDLGRVLLPRLEADDSVERIIALDVSAPRAHAGPTSDKLEFVRVDLTRPDAEAELAALLKTARLDALYHLAFVNSRVHGAAFAHELEVIGTMHVLAAAQAVELPRLIIPSLTIVYGARRDGAALHAEHHPLNGEGVRFVTDRVEVEHQVERFHERNPDTHLVVLRFAPIVGPTADNPFTRLLHNPVVPSVLGFDPLWQVIHEDDVANALHLALTTEATGPFNIATEATLPFSALLRHAGVRTLPLPPPLLRTAIRALELAGIAAVPVPLLDLLRYSWLADVRRARALLGFTASIDPATAMSTLKARSS